jgi:hypothetical protein
MRVTQRAQTMFRKKASAAVNFFPVARSWLRFEKKARDAFLKKNWKKKECLCVV